MLTNRRFFRDREHLINDTLGRIQILLEMKSRQFKVFGQVIETMKFCIIEKTGGWIEGMSNQIANGVTVFLISQATQAKARSFGPGKLLSLLKLTTYPINNPSRAL